VQTHFRNCVTLFVCDVEKFYDSLLSHTTNTALRDVIRAAIFASTIEMSHNRYNKEVEQCQVVDQTAGALPVVDGRTIGGIRSLVSGGGQVGAQRAANGLNLRQVSRRPRFFRQRHHPGKELLEPGRGEDGQHLPRPVAGVNEGVGRSPWRQDEETISNRPSTRAKAGLR
jgi:hypothetical protein